MELFKDFRGLNKKIVADRFPLPVMSEVLQNLANSDTFTTLDCMAGFWQIALDEDSKEKNSIFNKRRTFPFQRPALWSQRRREQLRARSNGRAS